MLVETNNDENKEVGSVYLAKDTTDYLQILLSVTEVEEPSYLMTRRYAIYAEASFSYNGETIPAGWSVLTVEIDENEHYSYSVEAMTEKETFNFGKSVTVTDVDADFAPLNGVVIGIVEGEPAVYYNITSTITNGTVDGDEQCEKYGYAYLSIEPSAGYGLPETVSVSGASYEYDEGKGDLVIYNPTGDVTVTATCPAEGALSPFAVNDTVTGVKFDTRLSPQEVKAICDNYVAETPTAESSVYVVEGLTSPIVLLSHATGEWALIVDQTTVWNETIGWQNLDANGEIALASSDTVSQIATYYAEGVGGNGVVWGNA